MDIKSLIEQHRGDRDYNTLYGSLNTHWRRKGMQDWESERNLNETEIQFVTEWLTKKVERTDKPQRIIAPPSPPPPPQYPDLRDELKASRERIALLENRYQEAVKYNEDRIATIEKLKAELEKSSEALAMLNRNTENIGNLKNREIADLSSELKDANEKLADLDTSKSKIEELQKSLKEAENSSLDKQNTIIELEKTVETLAAKVEKEKTKFTLLDVINVGEIGAGYYGAGVMIPIVGYIIGLPVAAYYLYAIRTAKNSKSKRASKFAVSVCYGLAVVFGLIHYNTAMAYIDTEVYDKSLAALGVAIILSGVGAASLRQTHLQKLDNIE